VRIVAGRKDLRASWIWVLFLFTFAGFLETVFWGHLNAFTPIYLPHLGVAKQELAFWVGASVAIAGAVGIPFLPLCGALADRYSRQPIIVRSFFAHLVAGLLALLAGNIWIYVIARSIQSLSLGNSGRMMTTLSESVPSGRVGLAFSIMNSASPVGAFVGPLLGGPVVDSLGFRSLLAVDVGLMALVILALSRGYRDWFQAQDEGALLSMALGSLEVISRSPRLRALFPALFLLLAGWQLSFTYVPLLVTRLCGGSHPATTVGVVMGAGALLTLLISPILGAAADRLGHWKVLLHAALVEVFLWPIPGLASSFLSFDVAWTALNGVASSVFALSFSVLSGSVASEGRGRVMAFAYLPLNLGTALGPGLGSVITRIGLLAIFPTSAVLTGCGILVLILAQRQRA
jgi:MFS family permease